MAPVCRPVGFPQALFRELGGVRVNTDTATDEEKDAVSHINESTGL